MLVSRLRSRAWSRLRAATPLTLSEADLVELQGLNERVSLEEVEAIYLPLSRLLNLHVAATQTLHKATDTFLGSAPGADAVRHRHRRQRGGGQEHVRAHPARAAGAVAGASRASIWSRPTDFCCPIACSRSAACCTARDFPRATTSAGWCSSWPTSSPPTAPVRAPVYSHQAYDIVPGEFQVVDRPDIVIVEGLNVLQTGDGRAGPLRPASSSPTSSISRSISMPTRRTSSAWYVARFLRLRETVFRDPRLVLPPLRGARATPRPSRPRGRSGARSTASTCARTSRRRASAPG